MFDNFLSLSLYSNSHNFRYNERVYLMAPNDVEYLLVLKNALNQRNISVRSYGHLARVVCFPLILDQLTTHFVSRIIKLYSRISRWRTSYYTEDGHPIIRTPDSTTVTEWFNYKRTTFYKAGNSKSGHLFMHECCPLHGNPGVIYTAVNYKINY